MDFDSKQSEEFTEEVGQAIEDLNWFVKDLSERDQDVFNDKINRLIYLVRREPLPCLQ
jgi:hypothetical protein